MFVAFTCIFLDFRLNLYGNIVSISNYWRTRRIRYATSRLRAENLLQWSICTVVHFWHGHYFASFTRFLVSQVPYLLSLRQLVECWARQCCQNSLICGRCWKEMLFLQEKRYYCPCYLNHFQSLTLDVAAATRLFFEPTVCTEDKIHRRVAGRETSLWAAWKALTPFMTYTSKDRL